MKSTAILIPARYNSSRFKGKSLTMLGEMTMIERVVSRCLDTGLDTFVLTDNRTIAYAAKQAGATPFVDSHEYNNGTERCAGALRSYLLDGYDQFINVQGDMPDVNKHMINKVLWHLKHYPITTLFTDMPEEMRNDPNTVKMVRGGDKALWFGRGMTGYGHWHLGIYGYKRNPLQLYSQYGIMEEERVEKLEQLRWLTAGWDIGVLHTEFNGIEINTPEDAERWNEKWQI